MLRLSEVEVEVESLSSIGEVTVSEPEYYIRSAIFL